MMTVGWVFILRVREKDNKALVGVCEQGWAGR